MQLRLKRIATGMLSLLGAGALLAGFGATEASAQRFEYTYGGPRCVDAGRGVVQVSDGGYITVGETHSRGDGTCLDATQTDVYVTRHEADGSLAWSQSYNIGGADYAFAVREVQYDPSGQRGFIIVGYTDNGNYCGSSNDLFLLRIDPCGNRIWANIYGSPDYEEWGWDVVEAATSGDPSYGTRQGDFITAGYTTRSQSGNGRDGYMLRVSGSNGAVIWDAIYDGPGADDDYLQGVDEAPLSSPQPTGDIIAVGSSNSYHTGSYDGWIVRVDGNTGRFTTGFHGAAAYGGTGFEELWSVQELEYGKYRGEIAAVGSSTTLDGQGDVYVIHTSPNPCQFRDDLVFGDVGGLEDRGFSLREIPFPSQGAQPGDLVITGYMVAPASRGFGNQDLFLARVTLGNMRLTPGPWVMLYGGANMDWGWSVSPVVDIYNPSCVTNGFVVAGFTNSPNRVAPGDPLQLYLIKTDENLYTTCTTRIYDVRETRLRQGYCGVPHIADLREWCEVGLEQECQYWETRICLDRDLPEECRIERCECSDDARKRNMEGAAETGAISLSSYPNPVKSGGSITLNYTLSGSGEMKITVSDISGRNIYDKTVSDISGRGTIDISTKGWTSGTYIVNITSGGRTASTRAVVAE